MNILLGVTGSVGAKLTKKLCEKLSENGHEVGCIGTDSSIMFTDVPITTKNEIDIYNATGEVIHISLALWADCFLLCPCTSNTLNKYVHGICDNIVLSTLKAFNIAEKSLYIAPVMNSNMMRSDIGVINGLSKRENVNIIWPTVKKLACGDFGIGAMPELDSIVDVINGNRWKIPGWFRSPGILDREDDAKYMDIVHPGWFGAIRKHDIHTGVDLYCEPNSDVLSFEDGVIVGTGSFTGADAGCPWWNDSSFVSIEGKTGIIIYGEVSIRDGLSVGDVVCVGECIGNIVRILKKEPKSHIYGHSMDMLHVELLRKGTGLISEEWLIGGDRPVNLLDPSVFIVNSI